MNADNYAYRQAPWRKQTHGILNVLFWGIAVASIAMVYLSISAKMTDVKLKIQELHLERSALSREIADKITEEGKMTAFSRMFERAQKAGFELIDFDNEDICDYVVIPGYSGYGRLTVDLRVPARRGAPGGLIKPEYRSSLQEYLAQRVSEGWRLHDE